LYGQKETDDAWNEKTGADEIKLFDSVQIGLLRIFWIALEFEDECYNENAEATNWQINVEAPSPGYFV
jgi:hypothetical protein